VRLLLLLTGVVGCAFHKDVATDVEPMIDAPPAPIACGDLTCDPNATCTEASSGASCACKTGYAGDGMTCAAIDACATDNGGCAAECETTGPGTVMCYAPRTCAEAAAKKPFADDSTIKLYANNDPAKPWNAFCHGGVEYLTAMSATSNFGQYTASTKSPGMNVRTTYARMRIDPIALAIDICDRTFATSTGTLSHDPAFHDPDITVSSMPLGIAMDCGGQNSQSGTAGVNLTGTPFVASNNWSRAGNDTAGNANKMNSGRTVAITGGGNCGWNAPNGAPNDPFNACASLKLITLQYAP
jgi:hypothetical protein